MLRSLALKTLRDSRRGLLLWSVGLIGMVALMMAVYPTVRDDPALNDLVKRYPDALKSVIGFGGALDYASPAGYLGSELFSFMIPLLLIIAAVAAGSGAVAGEEERGTMELLLTLPIARGRLVLEKLASLMAEVAGLGVVLWASLWIGAVSIDMHISGAHLAAGTVSAVLVGVLFGALALAIGAATGRRGLSIGLTCALAVAAYLVNVLAPLAELLSDARRASPFWYYSSSDPLRQGLETVNVLVLVAAIAAVCGMAVLAFRRRDVAV
jgi:ABC-2 type transport system permease protein